MAVEKASLEEVAAKIISANAAEVHDVDKGEDAFVYSTGNRGPGYLMIKGLVGQPEVLEFLTRQLALKVVEKAEFDFINGNVTGGMIPAWELRREISNLRGKVVPYTYLRGSRKQGGHGELITGDRNNPLIQKGMRALIVEELVNYAGTTGNATEAFRNSGILYRMQHAFFTTTMMQPI